jgi:peptide/nickel transport system substrate-binding protein
MSVVLAGCGGAGGSTEGSSADAGTLVVAIPGTPQGVDIDRQVGPQTWTMAGQVYDLGAEFSRIDYPFPPVAGIDNTSIPGFTYPAVEANEQESQLIERCELTDDGRTGTYHLRKGVTSGYGNEFTAEDVLYRVERSAANKGIGDFLNNAANAGDLSQWKAVDEHTVQITADSPMPLICDINTNMYWVYLDAKEVKKHATAEDPWANEWVSTHGGGFGAYTIEKWAAGQEVVMVANPNYWGGEPEISRIVYRVVPESSNRVALLERGEVHMAEGLAPKDVQYLKDVDGVNAAAVRSNLSIFAVMNNSVPPFDDPRVRQAINLAIPRQDIVDEIYGGLAESWQGVMPSLYPGYQEVDRYTLDLEAAKQLLAEAGHADGFETVLGYNSGDPVQADVAVAMQTTLAEIGIRAELQQQPPGPYADLIQSKKATFGLWTDFPIQADLNYSMTLLYKSGQGGNYQNYSDPRVDEILERCVSTIGQDRLDCNAEAMPIIEEAAPIGWIAEPYFLMGLADSVDGFGWHTTQYYRVATMSLSE